METDRLDLFFLKQDQKGYPSGPPISRIHVKNPLIGGYKGFENEIFLTPGEYGPELVEHQIDDLIEELKYIKKKVRRKYADWRKQMRRLERP